jgi:DNA-binding PadR family transcriptional regulator
MRGTAMVPKGFIRYHVLEALNEKPMSGSEIMNEIEKDTNGVWKPSPGSVYPLLSWLQDNGYINELPADNGLKRYELTESGKALFEEQKQIRHKLRETGFMPSSPVFDITNKRLGKEKSMEAHRAMRRLAKALFQLDAELQENFSEQALNDVLKTVEEATQKLEEIKQNIQRDQI